MTQNIVVPSLGESVSEATVARWLKKQGDEVQMDEPIVELETDKITLEVNAPASGILKTLNVEEGQVVEVGALLAMLEEGSLGSDREGRGKAAKSQADSSTNSKTPDVSPSPVSGSPIASPAAQKMIKDQGLDLLALQGTGKNQMVTKEDVVRSMDRPSPQPAAPLLVNAREMAQGLEKRVKMTRLRQKIAERLKQAQNTAAMLTTFNEIDMSAVMALRAEYKDIFEKKHGVKLGFMSFFAKACVLALREIPAVNAEINQDEIVYKNYYHLGIAVGTDQGLVVPVVRNADQLNLAALEKNIAELGQKARQGKLAIEDLQGGTFTITNGGVYGSLMSTPILNVPQSGILGMHKIQERPVAIKGQILIRPMMYVALSYDHRIIDGREAVTFLVRVKECLEDPQRLILDV